MKSIGTLVPVVLVSSVFACTPFHAIPDGGTAGDAGTQMSKVDAAADVGGDGIGGKMSGVAGRAVATGGNGTGGALMGIGGYGAGGRVSGDRGGSPVGTGGSGTGGVVVMGTGGTGKGGLTGGAAGRGGSGGLGGATPTGSGGMIVGSGGAVGGSGGGVGGNTGSGGRVSTGGMVGSGGSNGPGGSVGTGGSSGPGGSVGTGGAAACKAPIPDACGSVCVDKMSDGNHCGRCGHSCLGGTCQLGACQPLPLATGNTPVLVVTVDTNNVYWGGDGGIIGRAPKGGGGPTTPLVTGVFAYNWAMASGRLYFVNDWEFVDMRSCALPDCASGPVPSGAGLLGYTALVTDPPGQNLFWVARVQAGGSFVMQTMNINAQTVKTLLSGVRSNGLAADNDFLYFGNYSALTIEKIAGSGGSRVMLAATPDAPGLVAVCGAHLYWTAGTATLSTVYSTPLPNGTGAATVPTFGTSGQLIQGLTCDDSGVYWTNSVSMATNGTIAMCPHTGCGGPPKVIAVGQNQPFGITTDATAVYWTTYGGDVFKVAK